MAGDRLGVHVHCASMDLLEGLSDDAVSRRPLRRHERLVENVCDERVYEGVPTAGLVHHARQHGPVELVEEILALQTAHGRQRRKLELPTNNRGPSEHVTARCGEAVEVARDPLE